MFRWLWENKSTLLLAFILAITVWVVAVTTEDPTTEKPIEEPVPIHYSQPAPGLEVVGQLPQSAKVTIRAPESVWQRISVDSVPINVDLSSLSAGTHQLTLKPQPGLRPLQITEIDPSTIIVTIEPLITKELPINILLIGDPSLEYVAGEPTASSTTASISGPASAVSRITEVRAEINIAGARQDVEQEVRLIAYDDNAKQVAGIEIQPQTISVSVTIERSDRYRLVSVIPKIEGSPAYGYRIASIFVAPELVQVTTSDPKAIDDLAGFVETEPIDLTGATDTVERRTFIDLPAGFTIVGNQTILVKVTIEAIMTSITLDLPIEIQGLDPSLAAKISPNSVIVTLTGPLAILEGLEPKDVRVVANLVDLEIGTHTITPEVIVSQIEVEAVTLPNTVEAEITAAPPTTPTPTQ
jgi:YbbR domain-containing protein